MNPDSEIPNPNSKVPFRGFRGKRFHHLSDERIILHLISDRGLRTVPGVGDRIFGKCEEPGFDASQQVAQVTGREVGSSDRIPEKYIAGDHKPLVGVVKTYVTISMAGCVDHFKGRISPMNRFAIHKESLRLGDIPEGKTK